LSFKIMIFLFILHIFYDFRGRYWGICEDSPRVGLLRRHWACEWPHLTPFCSFPSIPTQKTQWAMCYALTTLTTFFTMKNKRKSCKIGEKSNSRRKNVKTCKSFVCTEEKSQKGRINFLLVIDVSVLKRATN
jgi:hypothetical protein